MHSIAGYYDVTGTILAYEEIDTGYYKTCLTIKLKHIQNRTESHSMTETMLVYFPRKPSVHIADTIVIKGLLIQPYKNAFSPYYAYAYCNKNTNSSIKILHRPKYAMSRFIHRVKRRILIIATKHLSPDTYALFSSLFLGKKQTTKNWHHTQQLFSYWGIAHYIARSGLHLVICMYLYTWIFRFIPISLPIKNILLYILCCIYFLCSWASVPFVRAFLSYSLQRVYTFFHCSLFSFHIFSVILAITLVQYPFYLFCLNFQLSFGLSGALSLLAHSKKIYSGNKHRVNT